jgi:acetyltransferase-like isoleucine patch superfamily enzyme
MAAHNIDPHAYVHPQAIVEDSTIGARTKVWQGASIIRKAEIGNSCSVGANAIVDGSRIGDRCCIGAGAQIHPGMLIGHDVFIGPAVIFCNDAWPTVGKDGFDLQPLINGEFIVTVVEPGVSIGAGAIVLPGVCIGQGAVVAAGATVTRDLMARHILHRDGAVLKIKCTKQRMRHASRGLLPVAAE